MPQARKAFDQPNYYSMYSLLLCPNTLLYNQLFPHIFMPLAAIPKNKSFARLVLYSVPSKKPSAWPRILHFRLGSYVHFQWPGIHSLCLLVISLSKNNTKQKIQNKPYNHKSSKCFFPFPDPLSVLLLPPPFQKGKQPSITTLLEQLSPKQSSLSKQTVLLWESLLLNISSNSRFKNIALLWDLTPTLISVTL